MDYILISSPMVNVPFTKSWMHSVPGDRYGYSNHPKTTLSPKKSVCNHVRGHCSFGLVTVTVSIPGYRDFQQNTGIVI